jgi:prevent-host-death family protein
MKSASVAEIKSKLSEYLARVSLTGEHVVITKRDRPVAALVSMDQLERLKTRDEAEGLASAAGKWDSFREIADEVSAAYSARGKDAGRKISF